jgi:hypothetical protein
MHFNWKTSFFVIFCLLLLIGMALVFWPKPRPSQVTNVDQTSQFELESVSLNDTKYRTNELTTLSLPKSANLSLTFKFRWLTHTPPREVGTVKIIQSHPKHGEVIIQSASGKIKNSGKSSTMTVELRLKDDTTIGDAVLVVRSFGTLSVKIPCKIVESK